MFTNQTGNGFFSAEFKRHSLPDALQKIQVTRQEIKQILDEYDSVKTPGCFNPVSTGIKNIKALYEHLSRENNLTEDDLLELSNILIKIKQESGEKSKTHSVVKTLFEKLNQPIRFIEKFSLHFPIKETFPIICQRPTIVDDIDTIIKFCGSRDILKQLIIQYPDALSLIAKAIQLNKFSHELLTSYFWPSIFDQNKQEYAIDIALAFDAMRTLDRNLYFNEIKDQQYIAKLCTEQNKQFIIKHGEYSPSIAEIFTALHKMKLGKDNVICAEELIKNAIDKDSSTALLLRSAFIILNEKQLLNVNYVTYLLAICQQAQAADKLASVLVIMQTNQFLEKDNFNFIISNIQIASELAAVMCLLKKSFLLEMPGIKNILYQYALKIDGDIVEMIQKLFDMRLLNKNNFLTIVENHQLIKNILKELPCPSFSQEQFDAVIAKIKIIPEEKKASVELKKISDVMIKPSHEQQLDVHVLFDRIRRI